MISCGKKILDFDDRVRRIRDIVLIDLVIAVASFFAGAFLNGHFQAVSEQNKVMGLLTQVVKYEENAIEKNKALYDQYSNQMSAVLFDKVSVDMYQNIINEYDVFLKVDTTAYSHIYKLLELAKFLDDYAKLDTVSDSDRVIAYKWRDFTIKEVNELVMLVCDDMKHHLNEEIVEQRETEIIERYSKNLADSGYELKL